MILIMAILFVTMIQVLWHYWSMNKRFRKALEEKMIYCMIAKAFYAVIKTSTPPETGNDLIEMALNSVKKIMLNEYGIEVSKIEFKDIVRSEGLDK